MVRKSPLGLLLLAWSFFSSMLLNARNGSKGYVLKCGCFGGKWQRNLGGEMVGEEWFREVVKVLCWGLDGIRWVQVEKWRMRNGVPWMWKPDLNGSNFMLFLSGPDLWWRWKVVLFIHTLWHVLITAWFADVAPSSLFCRYGDLGAQNG